MNSSSCLSSITPRTRLFAVIGDPVAHSLSPIMHNTAFAHTGIDGAYVAFHVTDLKGAVAGIRALNISGCSVTIPHKIAIMDLIDEVEPAARQIGAVNTIVNDNGRLIGINSDSPGVMTALLEKTSVEGKHVAVLGAGGAARAVAHGVKQHGGRLTIFNRTPERGQRLADELGGEFIPLNAFDGKDIDVLVNTTPLGMTPNTDQMPIAPDCLKSDMTVMDIVYSPLETRLLRTAREKGCQTVDGLAMFVHQGAIQFERWTGESAPVQVMREVVLKALSR